MVLGCFPTFLTPKITEHLGAGRAAASKSEVVLKNHQINIMFDIEFIEIILRYVWKTLFYIVRF